MADRSAQGAGGTLDAVTNLTDFSADRIDGTPTPFSEYDNDVVLIVNTASNCGFTPQYVGLQHLQEQYGDLGFNVLGFPCDQFAHQEPAQDAEIADFCTGQFGVTFPMFAKVEVNGSGAHPLYGWLRSEQGGILGNRIKWNFTKFLVGRDGRVIRRYAPTVKPEAIAADIEKALG